MTASLTPLPVIGVPVKSSNSIDGWDSVLSILQMPGGVPVATVALDGGKNAGILAASRYPLAMGRDRLSPPQFAKLTKQGTPLVSILVTAALMIFAILADPAETVLGPGGGDARCVQSPVSFGNLRGGGCFYEVG